MDNVFRDGLDDFVRTHFAGETVISVTIMTDRAFILACPADLSTCTICCYSLNGSLKWHIEIDAEKWPYPIPKSQQMHVVKQNIPPPLPLMPKNDKLLINNKHVFTAPGYIDEIIYHRNHIYLHYDGPPFDYRNICCLDESGKLLWFAGEAFSDGRYNRMFMNYDGIFTGDEELIGVASGDFAIHIDQETGKVLGRVHAKMI